MIHVAWPRKPGPLHKHVQVRIHGTHRIKATDDKMTFIGRKLSVVVRYRTDTRQIWQATEFKSGDKSHQTLLDRPTPKEMMQVVHRLVTSATITYNCMSQSPGSLPAHIVLLWLPKNRLLRSLAPTNCLPIFTRSQESVRYSWTFSSITLFRRCWVIDDLRQVFICLIAEKDLSPVQWFLNWFHCAPPQDMT